MAKQTFEQKIEKIDEIINKLESSSSSLNESVKLYNKGIILTNECQQELEEAALKVKKISAGTVEE